MKKKVAALIFGLLSFVPMAGQADPYTVTELAPVYQYSWGNADVSKNGRFAILPGDVEIRDRMWSAKGGVSSIGDLFDVNFAPEEINNSGQILAVTFQQSYQPGTSSRCGVAIHSPGKGTTMVLDYEFPVEAETYGQDCSAHLNDRGHVIVALTDRIDPNDLNLDSPTVTRFLKYNGSITAEYHAIDGAPGIWQINNKDQAAIVSGGKVKLIGANGKERIVPFPGAVKKYAYIKTFRDDGQLLLYSDRAYRGPKKRRTYKIGGSFNPESDPIHLNSADLIVGTHYVNERGYEAFIIGEKGKVQSLNCLIPNSSRLSFTKGSQILPDGTVLAVAQKQDEAAATFVRLAPTRDASTPNYCAQSVKIRYGGHCARLNPTPESTGEYPQVGTACTVDVKIVGPDGKPVKGADVRIIGDGNVYTGKTTGSGHAVIGFIYQSTDCYTVNAPYGHATLRTESFDFPNCRYPV